METAIVAGSISEIAKTSGKPLSLAFMDVEIVVVIDTSGSMATDDSRAGRSRYDVACDELRLLQGRNPGKILVISFSNSAQVCLSGIPYFEGGGTDMAEALRFAKQYDTPGMQFIVISDGEPYSEQDALSMAGQYQSPISTVYVGPESDRRGREFLRRLAAAAGGKTVTADRAKELAASIQTLLLKG